MEEQIFRRRTSAHVSVVTSFILCADEAARSLREPRAM